MENAVSVNNLSVSYSGVDAINDINVEIKKGEFLGITGPNGGGKTTLLNAVLGLISTDNGKIEIMGKTAKNGRKLIGFVPQTATVDRDFPITVLETVMAALLGSGLHPFKIFKTEERKSALKILEQFGLNTYANRPISALSGGEFQRMLIARALVSDPEILLLDEPISNIDTASRNEIYKILKNLNNNGKTIIMVTHDLQNINNLFSRLLYINRTVIFDGTPSDFLKMGGSNNA